MRGPKRGPSPASRPSRRSIASSRSSSSRRRARSRPRRRRSGTAAGRRSRPDRSPRSVETATHLDALLGGEQLERRARSPLAVAEVRAEPDDTPVMATIVRSSRRVAATVSRAVRRVALIAVLFFAAHGSARGRCRPLGRAGAAAPHDPAGSRRTRGRSSSSTACAGSAAPSSRCRRSGGERDRAVSSTSGACRAATARSGCCPRLRARGLVTSVTPDVPLGTDRAAHAASIGYCTDPLCADRVVAPARRRRPPGRRRARVSR